MSKSSKIISFASFEADWVDELRKEQEELRREIEERKEQATKARMAEKAAHLIALCFLMSAALMIGTWDGSNALFVATLIILLFMTALTCHFVALAYREEADELGEGRDPWEH